MKLLTFLLTLILLSPCWGATMPKPLENLTVIDLPTAIIQRNFENIEYERRKLTKSVTTTETRLTSQESIGYSQTASLAVTINQASDITETSKVSFVVAQTGTYLIMGQLAAGGDASFWVAYCWIKTGSATYASATYRGYAALELVSQVTALVTLGPVFAIVDLNAGDTVHLGGAVYHGGGTSRIIAGDDWTAKAKNATSLHAVRIK